MKRSPAIIWRSIAARSERERVAAKRKLADLTLAEITQQPLIDPDSDDVTRLLLESFDQTAFQSIKSLTVGEFREYILDDATTESALKQIQWAIIPEIAAAVAKIMSNKDLVLAAAKIRNATRCRNTLGERGILAIRVQPNHPVDDLGGILLAAFERTPLRLRRRRNWRESRVGFCGDCRLHPSCPPAPREHL